MKKTKVLRDDAFYQIMRPASHLVGEVVAFESEPGKLWFIKHANLSRAHLIEFKKGDDSVADLPESRGTTNIGPAVMLFPINPATLSPTQQKEVETMAKTTTRGATLPGSKTKTRTKATASTKKANTDRKAAQAKRKAAAPAKSKKAPKVPKPCKCGCGGETGGHFMMGHDARFKGWLLRLERGKDTKATTKMPKVVMAKYKWVKRGNGIVPRRTTRARRTRATSTRSGRAGEGRSRGLGVSLLPGCLRRSTPSAGAGLTRPAPDPY